MVFFHADFSWFAGGFIGVDVFFVISGYLITTILLNELNAGSMSILNFYERRARRILPALFFILLCSLPFAYAWMLPERFDEFGKSLIAVGLFVSNFQFAYFSDYFSPSAAENPLLHTWSLAVEEQFYLLFPLLLLALRKLDTKTQAIILAAIATASAIGSEAMLRIDKTVNFYASFTRFWELIGGALCAYWITNNWWKPRAPVLALLGLLIILVASVTYGKVHSPGAFIALPVAGAMLIILFAAEGTICHRILSSRPLVFIGLMSYSVYLWHHLLFAFARIRTQDGLSTEALIGLITLTLILGYLTYAFIEKPFRSRNAAGFRIKRSTVFATAAISGVAMIATGTFISTGKLSPASSANASAVIAEVTQRLNHREEMVRFGTCHIYPAAAWTKEWNCNPYQQTQDGPAPSTSSAVAVFGDSHAADIAAVARVLGFETFQATSPGCSLSPVLNSRGCIEYFDAMKKQISQQDEITQIWLVNRFFPLEISPVNLRLTLEYWSEAGKEIVFFSAKPEFPAISIRQMKAAHFGTPLAIRSDFTMSEFSRSERVRALVHEFGGIFVDTTEVYCSLSDDCGPTTQNGIHLVADEDHFSVEGITLFAQKLISTYPCPLDASNRPTRLKLCRGTAG